MTLRVGRVVLRRQFQREDLSGRVWVGRVAAHDERGLWLWVASGSAYGDIGPADGRAFRFWYVNLEEPGVCWDDGHGAGIDTVDYDLDVLVASDRTWRWKDEDEFAYHLAHPGVYWVDDAESVRAEGERVIKVVGAGEFPFDGTGTDYHPDPLWSVPTALPVGWDRSRARGPAGRPETELGQPRCGSMGGQADHVRRFPLDLG